MAVLALAARLADELALDLVDALADGLAVRDLRTADIRVDLELAHHAVDEDLEVQLAHAGDDRLPGLLIGVHAERRIFLGQLAQRDAQLVLVGLRLRLDRDVDDGVRELHALEDDRLLVVAERVARARVLEPDRRADVAGAHLLDLLALVRVHLQQARHALALVLARVVDVRAGLQHARIHAEEGQPADERVGRDLERQRRERRVVAHVARLERLVVRRQVPLHRRHVLRRRR